jgi:hypothetical protein
MFRSLVAPPCQMMQVGAVDVPVHGDDDLSDQSACSVRLSATATAAASRGVKFSGGRLIERSSV